MRNAKSHGGAGGSGGAGTTGLLTNNGAYQRWVKSYPERTKYVDELLHMTGMSSDDTAGRQHKHNGASSIRNSENRVQRVLQSFSCYLNPFDLEDKSKLYIISSGAPVTAITEEGILGAEIKGKQAKESFVVDRLKVNAHFFDPIKKLKVSTFVSGLKKQKILTKDNKINEFKEQNTIALNLLVCSDHDVETLMQYPVTSVPFCLSTSDGHLLRTNKAEGMKYLLQEIANTHPNTNLNGVIIQDGNVLFHSLVQVPENFRDISIQIFEMLPSHGDVIFSTDMYKLSSIKSDERAQRGASTKLLLKGPSTKRPTDWKQFLKNADNKIQLVHILLQVWSSGDFAARLIGRKVILIVEEKAVMLMSVDGIHTLQSEVMQLESTQEETDTRVVLYSLYAQASGYQYVEVKSPDSDIFFILLANNELMDIPVCYDTNVAGKKRIINIESLSRKYVWPCWVYMLLHIVTVRALLKDEEKGELLNC